MNSFAMVSSRMRSVSVLRSAFMRKTVRYLHNVHEVAKTGFTADSSSSYEHGRPEYSDEALNQIVDIMHKSGSKQDPNSFNIVELGAGTGKFTQSFARYANVHLNHQNMNYIATEPSEGFRQTLEDKKKQFPSFFTVANGTGDKIPAKDNSVDMIIVAQAFHWMANHATLQEVQRVLHPGGALVMIWNTYDYSPLNQWMKQIDDTILSPAYSATNTPRQQSEAWRTCFHSFTPNSFSVLHSWYSPYLHKGDRDTVVNRVLSTSVIVQQSPTERQDTLTRLNAILDTHEQLALARSTGQFHVPYVTQLSWVFKK